MEIIKHIIKKDNINLYYLTDVHLGAENFRLKEFKEFVEVIRKDKDGYWIGGGDYIEGITFNDPRFSPGELQSKYNLRDLNDLPRKQMKEFYKLIKPIQDKCLGLVIGNHEEKYIKFNHFDIYDYLSSELMDSPSLKLGKNGYVTIRLGNTATRYVKVYCTHGEGLSTSPDSGTVINSFLRLTTDKVADIYFAGHVHRLMETTNISIDVDRGGNLCELTSTHVIGGAWLKKYHIGTSGYFESKRGTETMPGYISVNLNISNRLHKLKINPTKVYL